VDLWVRVKGSGCKVRDVGGRGAASRVGGEDLSGWEPSSRARTQV